MEENKFSEILVALLVDRIENKIWSFYHSISLL